MRLHPPLGLAVSAVLLLAFGATIALTGTSTDGGARDEAPPTEAPAPAPSPSPSPTAAPAPVVATPTAPPPVPVTRAALQRALYGLVDVAPAGTVALVVLDEHGRTVVDRLGGMALMPASAQKLVTAAAALEARGPDHRFTTSVRRAGDVDAAGTLFGDLVLVGGGDPALASAAFCAEIYPVRPCTPLETLADRVVAAGIRRVAGAVVGDARVFIGPSLADGWTEGYLADLDARHVTGLTAEGGLDIVIEDDGDLEVELAPDPALTAATLFVAALEERGVRVTDGARATGAIPPVSTPVAEVQSPPLEELLRHTVQRSDNHLADHIFRDVGRALGGAGSWVGGERGSQRALADWGLDWSGARLADGSGLSRDNRLSARLLANLDRIGWSGAYGALWRDLMAVVGESGTLRGRLRETPALGRFAGKTGTLEDVVSLVGTAIGPDGRAYHLSAVVNGPGGGAWRTEVRLWFDDVTLHLIEDLYDCTRTETPAEDPEAPPTVTWECAATPAG